MRDRVSSVEAKEFTNKTNKAFQEKQASKQAKILAERTSFYNNRDILLHERELDDRFRGDSIRSIKNDCMGDALKAIYITALEAATLTDENIILAESMVDNYIKEAGGADNIIRRNKNKSYLLNRICTLVEDAAKEETEEMDSVDMNEIEDEIKNLDKEKEDTEEEEESDIDDATKELADPDLGDDSDLDELDEKDKEELDKSEESKEDNLESESNDDDPMDASSGSEEEDEIIDKAADEEEADEDIDDAEDELDKAYEAKEKARDEKEESENKDGEDSDDEKDKDDDSENNNDSSNDDNSSDDKSDDSDNTSDSEPNSDDEGDNDKSEEEDSEKEELDTFDLDADDEEDNSSDNSSSDEDFLEKDENEESEDSSEEDEEGSEDDENEDSDDNDDDSSDDLDDGDTELGDIDDSAESVNTDPENSDEMIGDEPDSKATGKAKMFEELEDEEDVRKAIDLIKDRVANAEEAFIKRNAEDKRKIDNLLGKISDNVKKVEDISDNDSDKAKVAEEAVSIAKQQYDSIVEHKELTIYETFVRNLTKSILNNTDVVNDYLTESGTLDMPNIEQSARVMYTFLETLNTLQLEDVNSKYIEKILNEMK